MTDILCRWLNEDLQLETNITRDSFAAEISNGYLLGKILHQHGLQDDFTKFSKGRTSEAKLNNFTRLEPSLHLLDIPFDTQVAHNVMIGDKGTATKLMYQIFVALNRKKRGNITAQSLRGNRSLAKVKMEQVQTGLYTQLMKQQTPRQFDLNFQQLVEKFQEKRKERDILIAKQIESEEERMSKERQESCKAAIEKKRLKRLKQSELYSQLKPLDLPKPKPKTAPQLSASSIGNKNKRLALDTQADIDAFEARLASNTNGAVTTGSSPPVPHTVDFNDKISTADYMVHIKERVQEGMIARRDRERRRRKVLMTQMSALKEQEERRREQMLTDRLNRQSLQEKRIVTQLMQVRKEKDNIRENRILRQKQYEKEREREFLLALEREALEAKRKAVVEEILFKAKQDKRKKLLQERARKNYEKHYQICHSIILQMVDLSTKIGEYRELTQGAIPVKMIRDWKLLFLFNKSLYEDTEPVEGGEGGGGGGEGESGSIQSTSTVEDKNAEADDILDDADLQEYLQVTNEWVNDNPELPSPPNMILTHIVYRLIDLVKPPEPPSNPPSLPKFYLKGSFIGLPFTGKTSTLKYLKNTLDVHVLTPKDLVMKSIEVYKSELSRWYSSTPTLLASVAEEEEGKEEGGGGGGGGGVKSAGEEGSEIEGKVEEEETEKQAPIELSSLAQLGEQAYSSVSNGEPVDDTTIVDIIVHELKELEDGSSWLLDNYPTTLQQALLLAKGLTGQGLVTLKEQSDTAQLRSHQFLLIPEREVEDEELFNLHAVCGLDIVVHFNASSDTVFRRSVKPSENNNGNRTDIQQSLLTFDSNWPQIKKWYNRFRTVHTINANQDFTEVLMDVHELIDEKLIRARQNEAMKKLGIRTYSQQKMLLISKSVSRMSLHNTVSSSSKGEELAPPPPPNMRARKRRPSSAGSTSIPRLRIKGHTSPRKGSDDITMTKQGTRTRSRGEKGREGGGGGEGGDNTTLVVPSAESELFLLLDMTAEPGEEGWQYCALTVHSKLIGTLAERWPEAEKIYIMSFCDAFRCLRQERDALCYYIFSKRNELIEYLKRPDCKQEFVSQWQRQYNELSLEMRQQDFMKSELHHRVDDLCDKLWDICDVRKADSEKERQSIIDDDWLQDHVGLISNHYISLMQAELTKFQDAVLLLKDYYMSMTSEVPSPLPECNSRVPLIELTPPEEDVQPTPEAGGGVEKGKDNRKESPKAIDEDNCVPLLIRQLITIPEAPPPEEKGRKKVERDPTPPPPGTQDINDLQLDTQLIVHSYNTALLLASKLLSKEIHLIEEATAEANKPPEVSTPLPTEQEEKPSGKGKKGGAKSPAGGKKGKNTPTKTKGKGAQLEPERVESPTPVNAPPSPAKLAMKQKMENMRREHTAALKHEEKILINRLKLIKEKAIHFIDHLKVETDKLYGEMEQWINDCYQHEVQSVNQLAEVLRCAIEQETKILYELKLPGINFKINQAVHTYHPSPPSSPSPVLEPPHSSQFTVYQLHSLVAHIRLLVEENEALTTESLTNLFELLCNKTIGENVFPTLWKGLNHEQVQQLIQLVYGKSIVSVDWRRLVLCLAQPYPLPTTEDLLTTLTSMRASVDVKKERLISRDAYMSVQLWLDDRSEEERDTRLKSFFFELFKDASSDTLDYMNMLLFLCATPDGQEGFFKALSLIKGEVITSSSDVNVTVSELQKVISFGFIESSPEQSIQDIYDRIGGEEEGGEGGDITTLPLSSLIQDNNVLRIIDTCNQYHLPDVATMVVPRPPSVEPRPPTSD